MNRVRFENIVSKNKGFLRGPFGGDLKKEIFVPQSDTTYKVYEQGVVLRKDSSLGRYYISGDYFDEKMHRFEVKPKDFLVSCSGVNYGAIHQLESDIEQGVINQALLRIRLDNEIIDDDFFNYFFQTFLVNMIIGKKGDSTIPNFPPVSVIKALEFDLPDIKIQKKVGNFLKSIDSKIELNNKINSELEAMAKLIYDYWFVQFDFPDKNGKPYKSSGGKMVYNEELKREIPEGWEVNRLGDYAFIKKGKLITAKTANQNGKVKVVSAGIDYSYFHSASNYEKNTITVSASGANAGFINFWREPIFACDCTTVRGNNDADTLQILGFLRMRQDYIYQQARGSAQPHVYPKDIEGLKIALPPKSLIEKYGDLVVSGNDKITNNQQQNEKLSELRDWLLPMLMNGQVRVK